MEQYAAIVLAEGHPDRPGGPLLMPEEGIGGFDRDRRRHLRLGSVLAERDPEEIRQERQFPATEADRGELCVRIVTRQPENGGKP
jgi:hypothetical protein